MTYEVAAVEWRKSTRCGESGHCVEIAHRGNVVDIRNSTAPSSVLAIGVDAFRDMIAAIKLGEFAA